MATVNVYLDNGNVYSYKVINETAAREHAAAIASTGYRSVSSDNPKVLNWYPVHRIHKIKIELDIPVNTDYTDSSRGT